MLKDLIDSYAACWPTSGNQTEQQDLMSRFQTLLAQHKDCFERDFFHDGHITGSALVVDRHLDKVLLTLHAKLGRWLQLGGHADGQRDIHLVAMREASEESGLKQLSFLAYERALQLSQPTNLQSIPIPFDLDIHLIPQRSGEPEHFHYDVRFIIVADLEEPIQISQESKDLRWFTLAEARQLTSERSMHRQFDKLSQLKEILHPCID